MIFNYVCCVVFGAFFGAGVVCVFVRRAALQRAQRLRRLTEAAARLAGVPMTGTIEVPKRVGLMLLAMTLGACSWLGLSAADASRAAYCASLAADVAAAEEKRDDTEALRAAAKLVTECEDEATELLEGNLEGGNN